MSKKHNQNILVTGGAGYIGSHACKALSQKGYNPVVIDNMVYGHKSFVKWGELEVGDIADSAFLACVMEKYKPLAVMHFAAYAYVGESVLNPQKYYKNNVIGTLSLLDACIDAGIHNVVFSSTCATYGIPTELPVREDQPQAPVNPYGASKLMIERILQDYTEPYHINSVSLRYFNAAGADVDGEIGESHDPETHLIPIVLDVAAGKRPFISIFGDDYPTKDGTCIRDYIHVTDLADAHVCALEYLLAGGSTIQLNLGTGIGYSVYDVIAQAEDVTGKKIVIKMEPRRAGDPPELVADASRAMQALGWSPTRSSISQIIQTAWSWHQKSNP